MSNGQRFVPRFEVAVAFRAGNHLAVRCPRGVDDFVAHQTYYCEGDRDHFLGKLEGRTLVFEVSPELPKPGIAGNHYVSNTRQLLWRFLSVNVTP